MLSGVLLASLALVLALVFVFVFVFLLTMYVVMCGGCVLLGYINASPVRRENGLVSVFVYDLFVIVCVVCVVVYDNDVDDEHDNKEDFIQVFLPALNCLCKATRDAARDEDMLVFALLTR